MTNEQLCIKAQQGDRGALSQLIENNIKLAYWVAGSYYRRLKNTGQRVDKEDMEQEAIFGLYKAAEKYSGNRGMKFSSYAVWYIRTAVNRSLMKYAEHESIDKPVGNTEDLTIADMIKDEGIDIEGGYMAQEQAGELWNLIHDRLDEQEQQVIKMRFYKNMIHKDIEDYLGLSPNRARQIIYNARGKLRRTPYMQRIRSEMDRQTSFYRSQRWIHGSRGTHSNTSKVEEAVLYRERLAARLLREYE